MVACILLAALWLLHVSLVRQTESSSLMRCSQLEPDVTRLAIETGGNVSIPFRESCILLCGVGMGVLRRMRWRDWRHVISEVWNHVVSCRGVVVAFVGALTFPLHTTLLGG